MNVGFIRECECGFIMVLAADSDRGNQCCWAHGVGDAVKEVSQTNILQVVLVSPQVT